MGVDYGPDPQLRTRKEEKPIETTIVTRKIPALESGKILMHCNTQNLKSCLLPAATHRKPTTATSGFIAICCQRRVQRSLEVPGIQAIGYPAGTRQLQRNKANYNVVLDYCFGENNAHSSGKSQQVFNLPPLSFLSRDGCNTQSDSVGHMTLRHMRISSGATRFDVWLPIKIKNRKTAFSHHMWTAGHPHCLHAGGSVADSVGRVTLHGRRHELLSLWFLSFSSEWTRLTWAAGWSPTGRMSLALNCNQWHIPGGWA